MKGLVGNVLRAKNASICQTVRLVQFHMYKRLILRRPAFHNYAGTDDMTLSIQGYTDRLARG